MTDWSSYFTKSEQAIKRASDLLLLGKKEEGLAEIAKAEAFLKMVFVAVCLNK